MTVNEKIDKLITELGISPNAFATKMGVKPPIIYNIIKGRNKPGYDLLEKIAKTYNVNPSIFFESNDYNEQSNDAHLTQHLNAHLNSKNTQNADPLSFKQEHLATEEVRNLFLNALKKRGLVELYKDYEHIKYMLSDCSSTIKHYDLFSKTELSLRKFHDKKIKIDELEEELDKFKIEFEELMETLKPFEKSIDQMHLNIIEFNVKYDKWRWF